MVNVANAKELMALTKYGDLFSPDKDKLKEEYRKLSRFWHPDLNKDTEAEEVFKKINELYKIALDALENNIWEASNQVRFIDKNTGKVKQLNFIFDDKFELGHMYLSNTVLTYVIDGSAKKFYTNALDKINGLKYDSPKMESEVKRYMPNLISSFETTDNKFVIVLRKTSELIRMKDVVSYYKTGIDDRTVAWMISRLLGLACYLDFYKLSHNGISLENCFISPPNHTVLLLGGWWYCVKQNEKMIGTQKSIHDIMPLSVKTSKTGSIETDIESIRAIGTALLGDIKAPIEFRNWLNKGSGNNPVDEMSDWYKTLEKSYGERKFIIMDLAPSQVYGV